MYCFALRQFCPGGKDSRWSAYEYRITSHKRSSLSSVSKGTSISKCTMSRGCGWNSDFSHFMRISRRTKQSMKIKRAGWSGNIARTRLKNCRRLTTFARIEKTGLPTDADNCRRSFLSVPSVKPAPIKYIHELIYLYEHGINMSVPCSDRYVLFCPILSRW